VEKQGKRLKGALVGGSFGSLIGKGERNKNEVRKCAGRSHTSKGKKRVFMEIYLGGEKKEGKKNLKGQRIPFYKRKKKKRRDRGFGCGGKREKGSSNAFL